jgi:hypothetical protein
VVILNKLNVNLTSFRNVCAFQVSKKKPRSSRNTKGSKSKTSGIFVLITFMATVVVVFEES